MTQKSPARLFAGLFFPFALGALALRATRLGTGSGRGICAVVLVVVSVAYLAALLLLSLRAEPRCRAAQVFVPHSRVFIGYLPAAVLLALGAVVSAFGAQESVGTMARVVALLEPASALFAAILLGVMAVRCLSGRRPSPVAYMCLCLYCALHLILKFQSWNTDPAISDYCYDLFALLCGMFSAYFLAGFCFDAGRRAPGLFWTFAALFFRTLTLADTFASAQFGRICINLALLLFAALGAWQLVFARRLHAAQAPEAPETQRSAVDVPLDGE